MSSPCKGFPFTRDLPSQGIPFIKDFPVYSNPVFFQRKPSDSLVLTSDLPLQSSNRAKEPSRIPRCFIPGTREFLSLLAVPNDSRITPVYSRIPQFTREF